MCVYDLVNILDYNAIGRIQCLTLVQAVYLAL